VLLCFHGKGTGPTDKPKGFFKMTIFFHGTSEESAIEIKENGFFTEMVFITPSKDVAEEYACGEEVITVSVNDVDNLLIDLDIAGAKGMTVDEANSYLNNEDWDINDYINAGYSLCVKAEFVTILQG
jgi:hypothetical protein